MTRAVSLLLGFLMLMALLGTVLPSSVLGSVSWFFYIPSLVFGSRFFEFGIGVGPKGSWGCFLTFAFYYVLCLVVVLAIELLPRNRRLAWRSRD